MKYDFKKIEAKWQKEWLKKKTYEPSIKKAKKPFYNLMMFPYPSAEGLHVGNAYAFIGTDIYGRFRRMQGNDVLEPIGLDGFGIHSENYALKIGAHPMKQAQISQKRFYKQLESLGNGFSWDEKLETYDPAYYKWTQWIFIQLFKKGLAYRKTQQVNWCPSCMTVLADEQVIAGKCERCSTVVIKKELEQWFFKITDYADRLLKNIGGLDWSEKVKIAQRNWIGKSEGAEIDFDIKTKEKSNFVLIHGYKGSPERDFFPWLKKEIEQYSAKTYIPALPDTKDPKVAEQVEYVLKHAKFDKNTVLLGHSLGTIVALKVLEKLKQPVQRSVLVAGFTENKFLDHDRFDEHTFDWKFNWKKIHKNAGDVIILRDLNDPIIPYNRANKLQEFLGGKIVDTIANQTHFNSKKEPVILESILPKIKVFTTRPDTLFGATYMVLAPEHPLISELKSRITNLKEVQAYVKKTANKSEEERIEEGKEKTGVELKGIKAVNPTNGKEIPVWIADYVLTGYGTGAIMAVPAHDERDFEFARKYKLPVIEVVSAINKEVHPEAVFTGSGKLINSGKFSGQNSETAKWEITEFAGGKRKTQYRLRDWLISRQRYWGAPIPMIHCDDCAKKGVGERSDMPGWYAVPENKLPVKLPFVKDFRPKGKGKSPLATVKSFYETKCPGCGGKARRETDVSDTFLDSSWYFLRYPSVKNTKTGWDKATTKKWLPVDMYIGGAEHSVLHLLYSRFLTMFFNDCGLTDFEEPFTKFRAHGLLIKEGAKMSKSKGNVVNPDEYVKNFGADTLRMYLMFLAPFEYGGDFRDAGIMGVKRFLERAWKMGTADSFAKPSAENKKIKQALHATIKKVTEDISELRYNTAISAMMILLNEFEADAKNVTKEDFGNFLKLISPFAPHISEEIWRNALKNKKSIHLEKWPEYDKNLVKSETFTLVVQVNGKVRDSMEVTAGIGREEAEKLALNSEKVKNAVGSAAVKKVIYVPGRLVNIVV